MNRRTDEQTVQTDGRTAGREPPMSNMAMQNTKTTERNEKKLKRKKSGEKKKKEKGKLFSEENRKPIKNTEN